MVDLSGVFDDIDLPADTLTLSVAGNTNLDLVSTHLVGTDLTLAFATDQHGVADVTIRATDTAGEWGEETFTVTVSPVNDGPVVVTPLSDVTVSEDAADTVVDLSGVFDDIDLPADTLTLSVAGNTNLDLVSTSLVGTNLTLAFATDQSGTANVTIRATDAAGDWGEETFTATVSPVADIELLGTIDFVELEGLDPSSGDPWYRLATTRAGYLTLEALTDGATLTLYDSAKHEIATSALINGKQRIDVVAAAPDEVYYFKLSGGGSDVDVRVTNLVFQDSGQVTVFGTTSDDRFEMVAAASDVGINDVWYNFTTTQAATVTFDGSHGNNTAMVHGTVGMESADLWADRAEIDGDGYTVIIDDVVSTTVDGLGGEDHATFYDSDADDELTVWPTGGLMLSDTMSHRVDNFENVVAFATSGGVDVVKFYDSPDNDDYVGTPTYNGLSGDGFDHEVWFFEASHAYATAGGIDVAKFYDSTGDDTYVSSPTDASLFNPHYQHDEMAQGFLSRVKFFEGVHAYATAGGVDTARLYDSSGDDLFYADPIHGALYNPTYQEAYTNGFYNRAKHFEEVIAFGDSGGRDVALLNGSPENDVFQGSPTEAVLSNPTYQKSYTNGFSHRAKAFEELYGTAGEGDDDQAYLDDVPNSIDLLTGEADHIRLTNETLDILYEVAGFDYVKAKTVDDGDTKDLPDPGLLLLTLELEGPWQE